MKKIYIALAVAATAMLASCEKEKSFNEVVGENTLMFTIQGTASTRASEVSPQVQKGVVFELESDDNGHKLFLEETIQDLNSVAPATKGTPAYTENVGVLYANDLSVYAAEGTFGTATFANLDDAQSEGSGWRYNHHYSSDPWPTNGGNVGFYLNMPANPTGVSITGRAEGKFSISYTSPATAADQQDILFGYRAISKADYDASYKQTGLPVLLNHALTGVKFAIANYDATKKIAIKSISFTGLVGSATCEITPAVENNYADRPTEEYSSASNNVVKWTIADNADKTGVYSSGNYGTPVNFAAGGSFSTTTESGDIDNGNYPASYSAAGNTNNLNDGAATQTFWFIPQPMTEDVTLTIKYTYGSDTEQEGILEFGKALNGITWKAGELRTYTIRVDDVNVKIEDTVTIGSGQTTTYTDDKGNTHTIYGGTKSGIAITNTGNTDAFIRVAITGQWVDADGAPVFSFTDFTQEDIILDIASWYDDQFGAGGGVFGVFDGLVGYTKNGKTGAGNTGWVKGKDGYYYYTTKVAPGAATGTAPFNSYTVTLANVPRIKVAGALQEVHFVMEVSAQAISAKTLTGGDYNWYDAWNNASGYDPR